MIKRCYSSKVQQKRQTYIGCSVCEEWKYFSNFKQWYDTNYKEGFDLDKDILVEGNKIYSPDTCCFVPHYLNSVLLDCGKARGDLPLGVTRNRNTYRAHCNDGNGNRQFKYVKSLEEAVTWYSITKKRVVFEQVQRALDEGAIDQRIADALIARKF
mgnify:CR=1 FL=1